MGRFTDSELSDFYEKSTENLTNFFARELAAGLFKELPRGAIKQLKRYKIIIRTGPYNSKDGLTLSEKGREILREAGK